MTIENVRFYVGDTATPYLLTDDQITLAIDATTSDLAAAAVCARALAARFSREVDSRFETIWSYDSQAAAQFLTLAANLDRQARLAGGLGIPLAGGISRADVEAAKADPDRVPPMFWEGQFANPPVPGASGTGYEE